MPRKAQSALEYLMIIALVMGLIIPTTYFFFKYTSESSGQIVDSQVTQIGRNIIDTVETVYFSGEGSRIILEQSMPENVKDIYIISNRELVFKVSTVSGESESVFFSSVNITPDISCMDETCKLTGVAGAGLKKIKIESVSDGKQVLISKFE